MKSALLSRRPVPLLKKRDGFGKKQRVLVLAGPTAVGKTKFSLSLAQAIGGEIVSADSAQVYCGMDIGTAKATPEERSLIAHHLIDVCDLDHPFNVAEFYKLAQNVFRAIVLRENVPIVVGGSGFYIHSLLYGAPHGPPSNPEMRRHLEAQMEQLGPEALYEQLQILDPDYAATISDRDKHKIIRSLEIMSVSERRVSDFPKSCILQTDEWDFRCWFIYCQRERLYSRIDIRCDEMIRSGFLQEVRDLEKKGLRHNKTASQSIGYRQALEYLETSQTETDLHEFIAKFKKASRHYAKKQFTWFRKEPLFRWLDCDAYSSEQLQEIILQDFEQND
ncbi:MAG TPA: tRNA (adenosine(37)-N6)-dimethylallyltransferase MiaA [Chlamydiales bacterium]|nr:tRNA (adenosine(37)-N6)-dimethylallyltransferase MiaA [Chlamydiales bacterium]